VLRKWPGPGPRPLWGRGLLMFGQNSRNPRLVLHSNNIRRARHVTDKRTESLLPKRQSKASRQPYQQSNGQTRYSCCHLLRVRFRRRDGSCCDNEPPDSRPQCYRARSPVWNNPRAGCTAFSMLICLFQRHERGCCFLRCPGSGVPTPP
jgi:hypothetical protein